VIFQRRKDFIKHFFYYRPRCFLIASIRFISASVSGFELTVRIGRKNAALAFPRVVVIFSDCNGFSSCFCCVCCVDCPDPILFLG
jgi:hypothetical protein